MISSFWKQVKKFPLMESCWKLFLCKVNESNLTGEPVINKTTVEADFDEEATYASNLVMRGTTVVDGHGTMRVLHVGDATEIGKVARQSTEDNLEPTPLNIQLTKPRKSNRKDRFHRCRSGFPYFLCEGCSTIF